MSFQFSEKKKQNKMRPQKVNQFVYRYTSGKWKNWDSKLVWNVNSW